MLQVTSKGLPCVRYHFHPVFTCATGSKRTLMFSTFPQQANPGGLTGLGVEPRVPQSGSPSPFVTFLGPFGTLHHLVKPESSSGKKTVCNDTCLKAVDWARILLVGRGLRDHRAPKPSFTDTKATWMGAGGRSKLGCELYTLPHSSLDPAPSQGHPTSVTMSCNVCPGIFFFTTHLLFRHQHPCKHCF